MEYCDPDSMATAATVCCLCGMEAVKRMVKKEGINKGKWFYGCGSGEPDGGCGFFKWADKLGSATKQTFNKFTHRNSKRKQPEPFAPPESPVKAVRESGSVDNLLAMNLQLLKDKLIALEQRCAHMEKMSEEILKNVEPVPSPRSSRAKEQHNMLSSSNVYPPMKKQKREATPTATDEEFTDIDM
jgi:hypothetical protein